VTKAVARSCRNRPPLCGIEETLRVNLEGIDMNQRGKETMVMVEEEEAQC
jgi:hypothetical protein